MKIDKLTISKKVVITGFLVAVGTVLQIVEGMFNVFAIPGGKIGIASIVSLIDLFIMGGGNAFLVAVLRAISGSILYGGIGTLPYSLGGAVVSVVAMIASKRVFYPKLSLIGISIIGAFFHNLMQILVATVIFKSLDLFYYFPVLTIVGTIGGMLTGYAAMLFCKKIGLIKI